MTPGIIAGGLERALKSIEAEYRTKMALARTQSDVVAAQRWRKARIKAARLSMF